jgi:alkylation response protein AidB-like acyl-CoA dehydrogenase
MRFLTTERGTLDRLLPGLDTALAEHSLDDLERPGGPALPAFRMAHGPGLLVPDEHGGTNATASEALRCTRAIGARSPSLGVAATMHNFSVAGLVALCARGEGLEWMLLDAIARDRLLVASAFAEGRTGQGVLSPTMRAVRDGKDWRVSGRKKPCSLSRSADIITASVAIAEEGRPDRVAVALIPRHSEGISVRPFWRSPVLTGAESDELVLDAVPVEDQLMIPLRDEAGAAEDDLQTVGLIWFTVLISGVYLGAASALVERLVTAGRTTPSARADVIAELEGAMLAVERAAWRLDGGDAGQDTLADALVARRVSLGAIQRVVNRTVELLGGMAFVSGPDVAYLTAACQALAFHPPSWGSVGGSLDDYFTGDGEIRID